jgi:hypothetical protein
MAAVRRFRAPRVLRRRAAWRLLPPPLVLRVSPAAPYARLQVWQRQLLQMALLRPELRLQRVPLQRRARVRRRRAAPQLARPPPVPRPRIRAPLWQPRPFLAPNARAQLVPQG